MKKILVISLVLALVMALILPTAISASSPPASFSASGTLSSIDTGNVKQLGHSDQWLVKDRHIKGVLMTSELAGPFTLTYDGIFQLPTQAGNLVGKLTTSTASLLVTAQVAPLSIVPYSGSYLPELDINGNWVGLAGLKAAGTFQAKMIFVPTTDGHVDYIVSSSFTMTGKYIGKH